MASGTKIWSKRPSDGLSDGKEHRLALALEVDIEAQVAVLLARHERGPALRVVDGGQDRVGGVGLGLVGEVDPRHHAVEQATGEHRHLDVRRLEATARAGHRPWL